MREKREEVEKYLKEFACSRGKINFPLRIYVQLTLHLHHNKRIASCESRFSHKFRDGNVGKIALLSTCRNMGTLGKVERLEDGYANWKLGSY
jgi:hypothetical protein